MEAPVSKCRRFWKVLISAIHKALGPPPLGRSRAPRRGTERQASPADPACGRRAPLPPAAPLARPSPRLPPGGAGAALPLRRGAQRERPEPAAATRQTGADDPSRPCRWWGWTWARRAATSPWPEPAASRPSPTSSATGAPHQSYRLDPKIEQLELQPKISKSLMQTIQCLTSRDSTAEHSVTPSFKRRK